MGRGFGGFLATAFIVVVMIGSIRDGSINIGGVADRVIGFSLDIMAAAMNNMTSTGNE